MNSSLRISASGLTAQRIRLDVIANNLANAETVQTAEGGPYRRQMVVFAARGATDASGLTADALRPTESEGVEVADIVQDPSPLRTVYQPGHPLADANGNVSYPNVNAVVEMVDLMSATRAYEANVAAINAAKSMTAKALDILR
jgi:flagellar basal-body rod protein FlgC